MFSKHTQKKHPAAFIYTLSPPSLGFYLSPIATIEFGRNLIEKWYEFNQNSHWSKLISNRGSSHAEGCKGKERDILSSFTSYLHCEAFSSAKVLIFLFVLSQVTATWRCQTPWEVTHLMFFCVLVSHGSLSQRLGMHLLRSAAVDYLCHVFSS